MCSNILIFQLDILDKGFGILGKEAGIDLKLEGEGFP